MIERVRGSMGRLGLVVGRVGRSISATRGAVAAIVSIGLAVSVVTALPLERVLPRPY